MIFDDFHGFASKILDFQNITFRINEKNVKNEKTRNFFLSYFSNYVMKTPFPGLFSHAAAQEQCVKSFGEGDLCEIATGAHTANLTRLYIRKYYSRGDRL